MVAITLGADNARPVTSKDGLSREAHREEVEEINAQIRAGELDVGWDSDDQRGLEECLLESGSCVIEGDSIHRGFCFPRLCHAFGVEVSMSVRCVQQVSDADLLKMRQAGAGTKVYYNYYANDDPRNHVIAVKGSAASCRMDVWPVGGFEVDHGHMLVGVTSGEQFFNRSNAYAGVKFYADDQPLGLSAFGADAGGPVPASSRDRRRDESVVDARASSGQANVSGGIKRAKRRVVASKSKFSPGLFVEKAYSASSGLMFNNLNEMFQDAISREYAQEIIETVFGHWGIPRDDPDALKYAEDLIWAFFIATTASNKADFDFAFAVPCRDGERVADFAVFSRVLLEEYGVTRRQFARGVADDLRGYIKHPDNTHLRPKLADRAGCDPQMAVLAFDGSTHCSGLTSAQLTFARLLESRNLFEDESVLSQGASQVLMEGIHGRVRSKVQR